MNDSIAAVVENGLIRPLQPLKLPNGTRVDVMLTVQTDVRRPGDAVKSPAQILADIAQSPVENPDVDPNASRDHDHILYGAPRRS